MRICALADLHFPRHGQEWYRAVVRTVLGSRADVLVIAGDVAAGREGALQECLGMFGAFDGPRLFVPGNHELWEEPWRADTERRYREELGALSREAGFAYLPGAPVILGEVGFVGTIGWYDYSFRQTQPPREDLQVTPIQAGADSPVARVMEAMRRPKVPWEGLTDEHYAGRALMWEDDGQLRSVLWNDAVYTNWKASDGDVTARMVSDLRHDLGRLGPGVRQVVGVCHCVPFESLLGKPLEDVGQAFCRAYMGARGLGEVFASEARCQLVLCGHSHRQEVAREGRITAANCSIGDGKAGPLELEL